MSLPQEVATSTRPLLTSWSSSHRVLDIRDTISDLGYRDVVDPELAWRQAARWLAEHPLEPGGELERRLRIHLITLLRTCNTTFGLSVGNVSLRSIGLPRPATRLRMLGVCLTLQMINPKHLYLADPEFLGDSTVGGMTGSRQCVDRALEQGFSPRCRPR